MNFIKRVVAGPGDKLRIEVYKEETEPLIRYYEDGEAAVTRDGNRYSPARRPSRRSRR